MTAGSTETDESSRPATTGGGLPVLCVDVIVAVHRDMSLSRTEVVDGGAPAAVQL